MNEQEQELHAREIEASRLNTINKIESLDPAKAVEDLHALCNAQGTLKHIADLAVQCKQFEVAEQLRKTAEAVDGAMHQHIEIVLAHISVVKKEEFGKVMAATVMKAIGEMARNEHGGTAPTASAPVAPAPSHAPVK